MLQVLFFSRLFADVGGRMAPRMRSCALRSPGMLLALACLATAAIPLFFVYLKLRWHSDLLMVGEAPCPSYIIHKSVTSNLPGTQ